MANQQLPDITLGELLEKNVNLLTILGIFNGLAVFAESAKSTLLAFCFLGLSIIVAILVFFEFNSYKIVPFIFGLFFTTFLTLAQIGLIVIIIKNYTSYLIGLFVVFSLAYVVTSLSYLMAVLLIKKARVERRTTIIWIIVSIVLIIGLLYVINFMKYITTFIQ